ncbi:MAG: flagellar biosynthesis repressor FlbT [Alphaproteobacteria bacterium RIFCSPHIGHO2_12_FULL_63_12]|nr:MAG: flagellar biosynthesis repressor FlbT [Alphaproteobacteria bacterium RIFCSPHIGHO2_12_FULL_63_12]
MALKLTLKPGEKIAINGAVIVNGDRRTEFLVENRASILRETDIMRAEEATTPARRVYLPVMMMALDPSARKTLFAEFDRRLTEFANVLSDPAALSLCLKISASVANGAYYKALGSCRALIEFENERLSHVA